MKSVLKRLTIVIAAIIVVLTICVLALAIYFEPRRNGLNMAQWLQALKTDKKSTNSPLQIIRIRETEDSLVKLELPLSFDLMLTNDLISKDGIYNNGKIWFLIDDRDFDTSSPERAPNGNCLFWANKDELHPGTNRIQAHMVIARTGYKDRPLHADGPVLNYVSTNLFSVNHDSAMLYPKGLLFYAKVKADNATYRVELRNANGQLIQSFSGKPNDEGIIDVRWDAITDSGKNYFGQRVKAIYEVTVPGFPPQTIEQTYQVKSL